MFYIERRGRKHNNIIKRQFKKMWFGIAIIIFTGWVLMMLIWAYQDYTITKAEAVTSNEITIQMMQIAAQKAHLSQDVIAKLDQTAKIQTSNTQKELSRYWITRYFGKDAPIAEKVFTCESNLNPMALNGSNTNGSRDLGIPQINSVHAKEFERMYNAPFDIGAHDTQISIQYAKYLYDRQGWGPWTCSKIVGVI